MPHSYLQHQANAVYADVAPVIYPSWDEQSTEAILAGANALLESWYQRRLKLNLFWHLQVRAYEARPE